MIAEHTIMTMCGAPIASPDSRLVFQASKAARKVYLSLWHLLLYTLQRLYEPREYSFISLWDFIWRF